MKTQVLTHIDGIEIYRRKLEILPKNRDLLQQARNQRKDYNLAKVIFWQQVRNKQFHGIDFDRQRIIGNYIVDFYIKSLGVAVFISPPTQELNDIHEDKVQEFLKTLDLRNISFSQLRIKNDLRNVMRELEVFIIQHFS